MALMQTNIPRIDAQFVEPKTGIITQPWHRLLVDLWRKSGGSSAVSGALYLKTGATGAIGAYDSATNKFVANVLTKAQAAPAATVLAVGSSPMRYEATTAGSLVASEGSLELSRDAGANFYPVSKVGGAMLMQAHDLAQITWYGAAPILVFFPNA